MLSFVCFLEATGMSICPDFRESLLIHSLLRTHQIPVYNFPISIYNAMLIKSTVSPDSPSGDRTILSEYLAPVY